MNTLIINILERTAEIGTIRAIGGSRGFIRLVFLVETLVLNGLSGLGGIAVSFVLIAVVSGKGISLPPVIARYLVGGGRLYMSFEPGLILQALLIIIVISVIATLYPLSVATRVTPLKAMSETMQ
jgi:ABC-type antimicrobial peptide transport system permease subunit